MNLSEFFGVDSADVFESKEQAEGFLAGTDIAAKLQSMLITEYKDRSRAFRESVLLGILENI